METKEVNSEDSKVYEAGFHLVPTLAEEALPAEVAKIKKLITDNGGEIISEGAPELKVLSYSVSKTVKAIKSNYSKGYFGWVKFTLTPEAVLKVKTAFDASDTMLRYLIVSTVKESTLMADKEKRAPRPEASVKANEMNSADVEKAIDELVIN